MDMIVVLSRASPAVPEEPLTNVDVEVLVLALALALGIGEVVGAGAMTVIGIPGTPVVIDVT